MGAGSGEEEGEVFVGGVRSNNEQDSSEQVCSGGLSSAFFFCVDTAK